jgi:hypothetical protein
MNHLEFCLNFEKTFFKFRLNSEFLFESPNRKRIALIIPIPTFQKIKNSTQITFFAKFATKFYKKY